MSTEREISYGGVVVRDGEVLVIAPAGRPQVTRCRRAGRSRARRRRTTAAREVREETGVEARIVERLGDVEYWYRRSGLRVFKTVGYYLCDYVSGDTADHDDEVEEARWMPLERAADRAQLPGRARIIERALSKHTATGRVRGAMQVLNFYSTVFADQMKRGRKTATIRLGDKTYKYKKNQLVLVTVGYQYSPREKLFHAVIDNVEVKRVKDLSPRDIEHDNPEFRRTEELIHFLEQIYGKTVSLEDTVTVVRFSQIIENPPDFQDRLRGVGGAQN